MVVIHCWTVSHACDTIILLNHCLVSVDSWCNLFTHSLVSVFPSQCCCIPTVILCYPVWKGVFVACGEVCETDFVAVDFSLFLHVAPVPLSSAVLSLFPSCPCHLFCSPTCTERCLTVFSLCVEGHDTDTTIWHAAVEYISAAPNPMFSPSGTWNKTNHWHSSPFLCIDCSYFSDKGEG